MSTVDACMTFAADQVFAHLFQQPSSATADSLACASAPGSLRTARGTVVTKAELVPLERVERVICFLRGHKVILDSDLAAMYEVEPRVLNQAVKRNVARFPEDFMFSSASRKLGS
jgi:hypothetical protein